ncbi:MAG TPA: DUF4389 domain-containing protein [Dehalococcoidia bacterium]|nr:DUF4389 domain-containing protein [Dehalococcoidia bacterium]
MTQLGDQERPDDALHETVDSSPPLPAPPSEVSRDDELLYPVRAQFVYAEPLSRWRTALRLPLLIPAWIFLGVVTTAVLWLSVGAARLAIFFRRKHPDWLFEFHAGYLGFATRFQAYIYLLTDKYPSFSQEAGGPVTLEITGPLQGALSRWRGMIWRSILLVPHFVAVSAIMSALSAITLLAWFAILFTGRYPEGLFTFAAGAIRWETRIRAYMLLLTDRYPPYALSDEAPPASRRATIWSGIAGFALTAGTVALIVVGAVIGSRPDRFDVDYDSLSEGRSSHFIVYERFGGNVTLLMVSIHDPGDEQVPGVDFERGQRVVIFEWELENRSGDDFEIDDDFKLYYRDGVRSASTSPVLVTLAGEKVPEVLEEKSESFMQVVFVIPDSAEPTSLRLELSFLPFGGLSYEFE